MRTKVQNKLTADNYNKFSHFRNEFEQVVYRTQMNHLYC